jgi:1-deoxy-D-xylulose-5-phosphate reductoisomerase
VLSAANEEAVALFLRGAIGFNEIYDRVAAALESAAYDPRPELDAILAADAEARRLVRGRA